jgi:signal transduction histidine kinase
LIAEESSSSAEWIAHLRAGIRTLSGTVNNVLSMHDGTAPRLSQLEVIACVGSAVEFMRPLAQQADVALEFVTEANPLSTIGNEDGVRQVILNLVSNAIRHTQPGGAVTVAVKQAVGESAARALIEVRDTGCGIPAEMLGHVFDAGFSGTGETTGLGLAVCKRIVKQHGGAIAVESTLGVGTTFRVELAAI